MKPIISLIIATKNAADSIGLCLDSVINQTYPPYEILIQDAGSTDGTDKILKAYAHSIRLFVERDTGIYDAWNYALQRANGNWLMFLGADDRLAHEKVLENRVGLLTRLSEHVDLVSGRIALVDKAAKIRKIVGEPWDWQTMQKYQNVAHVGLMHHKSLFDRFGMFDTRYRIAGDYEFLLRLGKQTHALFVDDIEIMAGAGGISQTRVAQTLWETFQIQSRHKDIGALRAAYYLAIAWMKYGYRRLISGMT